MTILSRSSSMQNIIAAATAAALADGIAKYDTDQNDQNVKVENGESSTAGQNQTRTKLTKENSSLRRGKWTPEEEAYSSRLIQEFRSGRLVVSEGMTLRSFLSIMLNCDPMRISKKFTGANCIGKQVFKRSSEAMKKISPEEQKRNEEELAELERQYLERVAINNNSSGSKSPNTNGSNNIKRSQSSNNSKNSSKQQNEASTPKELKIQPLNKSSGGCDSIPCKIEDNPYYYTENDANTKIQPIGIIKNEEELCCDTNREKHKNDDDETSDIDISLDPNHYDDHHEPLHFQKHESTEGNSNDPWTAIIGSQGSNHVEGMPRAESMNYLPFLNGSPSIQDLLMLLGNSGANSLQTRNSSNNLVESNGDDEVKSVAKSMPNGTLEFSPSEGCRNFLDGHQQWGHPLPRADASIVRPNASFPLLPNNSSAEDFMALLPESEFPNHFGVNNSASGLYPPQRPFYFAPHGAYDGSMNNQNNFMQQHYPQIVHNPSLSGSYNQIAHSYPVTQRYGPNNLYHNDSLRQQIQHHASRPNMPPPPPSLQGHYAYSALQIDSSSRDVEVRQNVISDAGEDAPSLHQMTHPSKKTYSKRSAELMDSGRGPSRQKTSASDEIFT